MRNNKFMTGMTTGAIIGAAMGMMMSPDMDKRTKKKIRRSGKAIKNMATDMYSGISNWMR
ncbi:YtxH domain-containing protein [Clostridium amazonitimonense]|uniref:YtxH domain-containing protein n=1 Tax=Clostridium amazonitimonense TaxID=1499689 RepID=UPI00050999D0|nr:YtxH domain-containing protein [Clostridium amazonitimonense]